MTASELLEDLRRRGVELLPAEGRLRWKAPRGAMTADLLAAIRSTKVALLAELEREPLAEAPVLELRESVAAVRLGSARFGEVWLALDDATAASLVAEENQRNEPRPVLRAEDVAALRGKPEAAVRAALEVARAFPAARVLQ